MWKTVEITLNYYTIGAWFVKFKMITNYCQWTQNGVMGKLDNQLMEDGEGQVVDCLCFINRVFTSIACPSSKSNVTTHAQWSQLENLSHGKTVGETGGSSIVGENDTFSLSRSVAAIFVIFPLTALTFGYKLIRISRDKIYKYLANC